MKLVSFVYGPKYEENTPDSMLQLQRALALRAHLREQCFGRVKALERGHAGAAKKKMAAEAAISECSLGLGYFNSVKPAFANGAWPSGVFK